MKQYILIILSILVLISCSQKNIPFGLRSTINKIDKSLNDTVKYDFKLAPENVATSKHHFGLGLGIRNSEGLWSGSLLKTYFKINGIKHPDDMSGIILTTYHRELNNRPIKFREQKKYYKEYWKMARIGGDTFENWYQNKNPVELSEDENEIYYKNFKNGRLVLGNISAWKQFENGNSAGTDVKMVAEIIESNERILKLKILELDKPKKGFKLYQVVGDTIESDPFGVFLIPLNE